MHFESYNKVLNISYEWEALFLSVFGKGCVSKIIVYYLLPEALSFFFYTLFYFVNLSVVISCYGCQ